MDKETLAEYFGYSVEITDKNRDIIPNQFFNDTDSEGIEHAYIFPCLQSGNCCRAVPCAYGEVGGKGECKYLARANEFSITFDCIKYGDLVFDTPAFDNDKVGWGVGCKNPFTTERSSILSVLISKYLDIEIIPSAARNNKYTKAAPTESLYYRVKDSWMVHQMDDKFEVIFNSSKQTNRDILLIVSDIARRPLRGEINNG